MSSDSNHSDARNDPPAGVTEFDSWGGRYFIGSVIALVVMVYGVFLGMWLDENTHVTINYIVELLTSPVFSILDFVVPGLFLVVGLLVIKILKPSRI